MSWRDAKRTPLTSSKLAGDRVFHFETDIKREAQSR